MKRIPVALTPDETRGHLAMLAFSALVAGSFSLGAIVANDIDPQAITAARFAFATIVMGMVAFLQGCIRRAHFAAPWRFFVLGGLFTIYFVLMFEGLKTANPVSAAAVFTLMPLMSAGFGFLLLRQITTLRMALALGIAAAGALWVIFRGDLTALAAFDIGLGEVIYFIGCIAHALYTPMVRRLSRGEGAAVFTFGMLIAGSILLGGGVLAENHRHRLECAGTCHLDHHRISDAVFHGGIIFHAAICDAAPAQCQGRGLFLSDTGLGDPVGNWPWQPVAGSSCSAGDWCDDHRVADAAAQ